MGGKDCTGWWPKRNGPKKEPPHRFRETSTVRSSWQHKTEEKEGGGEGRKAIVDDETEQEFKASWRMTGANRAGERG